jgi:hypothetical protein
MMNHGILQVLAVTVALVAAPVLAQGATVSSPIELARASETLKPGQWVWAPSISPTGPVIVYVDLGRQIATVYRNGVGIGVSTVSSGKKGHETPTGVFTILQKDAKHHSSKYHNASMPYQQRLTWDGVALHGGGLPGYPESHGCVHLPLAFAKLLFGVTELGLTVVMAGAPGAPTALPHAGVLSPVVAGGTANNIVPLAPGETYRWTPELAPKGPLTIVISQSDKRVVVSRNGIEIGRAHAELDLPDDTIHVLAMTSAPDGTPRWVTVDVPGHGDAAGRTIDPAVLQKLRVPEPFLALVRPMIVPGTTILVTKARVTGIPKGAEMIVMDSSKS